MRTHCLSVSSPRFSLARRVLGPFRILFFVFTPSKVLTNLPFLAFSTFSAFPQGFGGMVVLAMPVSTTVVCKQPLDAKKPNMLPRQGGSPCLLHVQELACLGSAGLASPCPIEQAGSTTRLAHTDKSTIPAIGNDHSWTMRSRRRCATSLYRYR